MNLSPSLLQANQELVGPLTSPLLDSTADKETVCPCLEEVASIDVQMPGASKRDLHCLDVDLRCPDQGIHPSSNQFNLCMQGCWVVGCYQIEIESELIYRVLSNEIESELIYFDTFFREDARQICSSNE
ncbi:unnamed protein product [Urochloa humidicola]